MDANHFKGTTIDYIAENLMIHLDDTNHSIQEAVYNVLLIANDIDRDTVRKHAQEGRINHRSSVLCDKLLSQTL